MKINDGPLRGLSALVTLKIHVKTAVFLQVVFFFELVLAFNSTALRKATTPKSFDLL